MRKRLDLAVDHRYRIILPSRLPFDFYAKIPEFPDSAPRPPSEVILLLHGYSESGKRILDKLLPALPEDALILAPNGPFPMPQRTERGTLVTHSWYFYDPGSTQYYIDMEFAVECLRDALLGSDLPEAIAWKNWGGTPSAPKFSELPIRIIGFSQGGFLAPVAAQKLPQVRQFIGIACEYLSDEIFGEIHYRVDGIHGLQDDIVPAKEGQRTHQLLLQRGVPGEFHLLRETTHRIDDAVRTTLKHLLTSAQ
jgi:predicted esterase